MPLAVRYSLIGKVESLSWGMDFDIIPETRPDSKDFISVIHFRRSKPALADGFFQGAYTRVVFGSHWGLHPDDVEKVLPDSRHKLKRKNKWAEVPPRKIVRIIDVRTATNDRPSIIARVWT